MKLAYKDVIRLWSATMAGTDKQMLAELITADGMPMTARVRLVSIADSLAKHAQRFAELRDACLARNKMKIDGGKIVPEEDGMDEDDAVAVNAKVEMELSELLDAKADGIQPLKGSMLASASGDALALLTADTIYWLSPILQDDL